MDIYDFSLSQGNNGDKSGAKSAPSSVKGKEREGSENIPATTPGADGEPTLENEVNQLVGNVSNWWSGFSKKSQQSFQSARSHIEEQGGLYSFARNEVNRFEAQLGEAQRAAREQSLRGERPVDPQMTSVDLSDNWDTKDGTEFDDKSNTPPIPTSVTKQPGAPSTSPDIENSKVEAIFDAEENNNTASGSENLKSELNDGAEKTNISTNDAPIKTQSQSFLGRIQSTLASDPRIAQLQQSFANSISSALASSGNADGHSKNTNPSASTESGREGANVSQLPQTLPAFSEISQTIQTRLPHLDWTQSQAMARRYVTASEDLARDVGVEMRTLLDELIRVVPPQEEQTKTKNNPSRSENVEINLTFSDDKNQSQPQSSEENKQVKMPQATRGVPPSLANNDDDDDFDWDADEEIDPGKKTGSGRTLSNTPAKTGTDVPTDRLEPTTGPPTTSWEGSLSTASSFQDLSQAVSPKKEANTESPAEESRNDDDSDWE